jgi:choice-of-anchor B domain-containing protein
MAIAMMEMKVGKLKLPLISKLYSWFLALSFALLSGEAKAQTSMAMTKLGQLAYPNWELNDVWGYADTLGNEYALVGARNGFDVVDVTVPANPSSKIFIGGAFSVWRDIKTWSHYAYVVHDFQFSWSTSPNEGVTIVDLDSLQSPHYKRFRPQFNIAGGQVDSLQRAHNIYIDENGVLYVFGSNLFVGGALMFDVATDPWNPIYLGIFDTYYLHDGYVHDNMLYGAAVNNGLLCVIDVTLKSSPQLLATATTPNGTTHNTWLSDDSKTVFTTDEVPGGYIAAYDISNLANVTEIDKLRTLEGTNVIPHNVHVLNDFLVTSYYTRGCQIVDAIYPDLLVEVGFYDTAPNFTGQGFNGAWGAYPFLPSGNILVTDIEEGLFILTAEYAPAARIYGLVVDSVTGNPIAGANVSLSIRQWAEVSNIDGSIKVGTANAGNDAFLATRLGYYPRVVNVNFNTGNYDTVRIAMVPVTFGVDENLQTPVSVFPNPSSSFFNVSFPEMLIGKEVSIGIYNTQGQLISLNILTATQKLTVDHNLRPGLYFLETTYQGLTTRTKLLVE